VLCWGGTGRDSGERNATRPAGRNPGRGSQQSRTKTSAGRGQVVRPSSAAVPDRNGGKENHVVPQWPSGSVREVRPRNGGRAVDPPPGDEPRMAVSPVVQPIIWCASGELEFRRGRCRGCLRSDREFPFGRTNRFLDESGGTTLPLRYICEHQPNRGINAFPT
jgi:hypothetical protein